MNEKMIPETVRGALATLEEAIDAESFDVNVRLGPFLRRIKDAVDRASAAEVAALPPREVV